MPISYPAGVRNRTSIAPPVFAVPVVSFVHHPATPGADETAAYTFDRGALIPTLCTMSGIVVGSLSGTSPGFGLGALHVPLNVDSYTAWMLGAANTGPFAGTFGTLDALGRAGASLVLPPLPAALAGLRFDHLAFAIAGGEPGAVSNAVPLTLQ